MSADISAPTPFSISPQEGELKRAESTQGNDQRVVQPRNAGSSGASGEHARPDGKPGYSAFNIIDPESDGLGAASINVEPEEEDDDEPELDLGPATGSLQIEEDETTGDFVYRIIDENTGDVIRQWPREELLRLSEVMAGLRGTLLDRKV